MARAITTGAAALREYERMHWGQKGKGQLREAWAPDPRVGVPVVMGELVAVTYRTRKGSDRNPVDYEHVFGSPEGERGLPLLAFNAEDGGSLLILRTKGTTYAVEERGIVR